VIARFLLDYPAMQTDIREAAMTGQAEKGRSVAHSLKANTGYLAALPLTEQARQMEKLFSSGLMEEARQALPLFEETGERLLRALQTYMVNLNSGEGH
jgi:HPt (histidine-containing phosphotransfer) domain-containing protein